MQLSYDAHRGVTYICEFLGEFATICKNGLVTQVGLIDEKT
jgi:hypothetical protein